MKDALKLLAHTGNQQKVHTLLPRLYKSHQKLKPSALKLQ